jgi:hypothetical protein
MTLDAAQNNSGTCRFFVRILRMPSSLMRKHVRAEAEIGQAPKLP